jgi:hypothetical protein
MTAIFYPDCSATSENGRYTLEARSPHNGTIPHRDGRKASEDEFAFKYQEHQREFRYQLIDNYRRQPLSRLLGRDNRRVIWERWQRDKEDSPGEVVVSDDGWGVIRTHGFRPEIIAIAPDGVEVVRVHVISKDDEQDAHGFFSPTPWFFWPLTHLILSTAGHYWSSHSWRYFFKYNGESYFVWRASWGQRLVVDLAHATVLPDGGVPFDLMTSLAEVEKVGVTEILASLSRRLDEVRFLLKQKSEAESENRDLLLEQVRQASSAFQLVGVHRIRECLIYLREWESIDYPSHCSGSDAMVSGWWVESQYFRPIIHQTLKMLGEAPQGFSTYNFTTTLDGISGRFPMPDRLNDRRERITRVNPMLSAEEVLSLLGSPDFMRRHSRQDGSIYKWWEVWEYDFRIANAWVTHRITWKEDRCGEIKSIEEVAPYWLSSDERENEYLRW